MHLWAPSCAALFGSYLPGFSETLLRGNEAGEVVVGRVSGTSRHNLKALHCVYECVLVHMVF